MEEQEELNVGIGTKEYEKLKPVTVKIVKPEIKIVGDKANKKIVCQVKHPAQVHPVDVSSVKYEKDNKINVTGLWYNLDEDKKIRKGSALAIFMEFLKVETLKDLADKEVDTALDDKGYLCFKAY